MLLSLFMIYFVLLRHQESQSKLRIKLQSQVPDYLESLSKTGCVPLFNPYDSKEKDKREKAAQQQQQQKLVLPVHRPHRQQPLTSAVAPPSDKKFFATVQEVFDNIRICELEVCSDRDETLLVAEIVFWTGFPTYDSAPIQYFERAISGCCIGFCWI